jgi:SnoaL-like domain
MPKYSLQELSDRAEIGDVFTRYATGIDTRNWELWRTCFVDDVEMSASVRGGISSKGADGLVAKCKADVEGLDATQHIIGNHNIVLDGDTAHCTSYLHAQHVFRSEHSGGHLILAGYYTYDMVRTPDGWKIRKYHLTITWGSGDASVWASAKERMAAK